MTEKLTVGEFEKFKWNTLGDAVFEDLLAAAAFASLRGLRHERAEKTLLRLL